MYNHYMKLEIAELQKIAEQHWDHVHELNKIKEVLENPQTPAGRAVLEPPDAMQFYERVLRQIDKLKSMDKEQQKGRATWLQLQEIDRLRNRAEKTGFFEWPTTFAPIGDGKLDVDDWPGEGLFSHVGYHVGNGGEHPDVRHYLLDCIFHQEQLPKVKSGEYMNEFGIPKSPQRLHKMADFLASMARNYKRNEHADYSQAIADYESDLEYLYNKYYVGAFQFDQHPSNAGRFGWPDT